MAGIMELSQQQLSKQDHYDYGETGRLWVGGWAGGVGGWVTWLGDLG